MVIVYHIPGPLGIFFANFILLIKVLTKQHRILIIVYFNLNKMLPKNITKVGPSIQNFSLFQCSKYSTHIYWKILDLVFDTSNSNTASSWLLLCSDYFSFLIHYFYIEFSHIESNFQFSLHDSQILALIS